MITNEMVIRAAWELWADQYVAGKTIAQLARETGRSPSTVTERMKRAGVYVPGRKGGAPRLDECHNGHSMEDHGKWIDPEHHEKGRFCSECKRIRERVKTVPGTVPGVKVESSTDGSDTTERRQT